MAGAKAARPNKPAKYASIVLLIALALLPTPINARAADEGEALMKEGRYSEAAKLYSARAAKNPSDAAARLSLGICLIKTGDFAGAAAAFDEALLQNPTFADGVARAWKAEGAASLKAGKPDHALAYYAKAIAIAPSEAPKLGAELIEAADRFQDENERARLVVRAAKWTGAEFAAERTANWYVKKLGIPRTAALDEPGWANMGGVRPGDSFYYLSAENLRQKDAGALRILPAAVELPVRIVIEGKDTQGQEKTDIWLGRNDKPAKVWYWLIPGQRENKTP